MDNVSQDLREEQFYNFCYVEELNRCTTVVTRLHTADYLDKAFKVLPSNANIDKGRCGIGGTTLEIKAERHSIFVVCTLGGIIDKANDNPEVFPIYGKMKPKDIIEELNKVGGFRKLFVTPDSFWKIIEASKTSIGLDKLYSDYFVLYDESHTAITEGWRPNVLSPFQYIWAFKNKSFITATPCELNDPNFLALQSYRIEFHEPYVGKVQVYNCNADDIDDCIDAHIANAPNLPGNLFFFYNSVTEIAETIKHNMLTDCHIYCADKGDNYEKLPEQLQVFRQEPTTGEYAKINFLTTRYFECFDLWAPNATIILVTNTEKTTTRIGISNKGTQAVGRIRNKGCNDKPHEIIHITNHRGINKMKTRKEFKYDYSQHKTIIEPYNNYIEQCKAKAISPLESFKFPIQSFTDINDRTNEATFSQNKLDQVINELVSNEEFNHINFIVDAWKHSKYEATVTNFKKIKLPKKTRRASKVNQFKELIELIHQMETTTEEYMMGYVSKKLEAIKSQNPFAFEAYHLLKPEGIELLGFKESKVRLALINVHNEVARVKLLKLLDIEFNVGDNFTTNYIANRLQFLYNLAGLKNPDGTPQRAYIIDLEKNGWYKLEENKVEQEHSKVNGRKFVEKLFDLSIVEDKSHPLNH